jgi:hypothetical protein
VVGLLFCFTFVYMLPCYLAFTLYCCLEIESQGEELFITLQVNDLVDCWLYE